MFPQASASSGGSPGASGGAPAPSGGTPNTFQGFTGASGAGGPARSPGAAPSAAAAGGTGAGQAADSILQSTMAELQRTQQAFGQHQAQFRELQGSYEGQQRTLDALRRALNGGSDEAPSAPDPVDTEIHEAERALEYYIAQGFEAEKAGEPMPLTIDTGIRSLQDRIRYLKEGRENRTKISQLEQAVRLAFDGDTQMDLTANRQLGSSLMSAIDTIYGQGDQNLAQKRAMWGAVSNLMQTELTNLKKDKPAAWDRIRRDPGKLQKLAQYFVEQTIPPRARELLQMHEVQSRPLTEGDLWGAWEEAGQVQDPRQRDQLRTKIRQDLLAVRFSRGRNAAGAQRSTNALYSGNRRGRAG